MAASCAIAEVAIVMTTKVQPKQNKREKEEETLRVEVVIKKRNITDQDLHPKDHRLHK